MNYMTEQRFDTIKKDKREIKRMVYAVENRGDSYNVIEECICTLEEYEAMNDNCIVEVENIFSFVISRIMEFIKERNLSKDKIEHVRAYIDIFENPVSNMNVIKYIEIYEDYDERYMDKEIDRVLKNMHKAVNPKYVPIINDKSNRHKSNNLKDYNKKMMLDIIKQKADEINNGGIRINKLSAILKLEDKSIAGLRRMMKAVANLKIKPKAVYISEDTFVVMYISNKSCNVFNIEEYKSILTGFVDYINNVEEMDLYLDESILNGDYRVDDEVDNSDKIDFNKLNFDSKLTLFAGTIGNEIIQAVL